jgi:hypothetical protein
LISWRRQGSAIVGELSTLDGRRGSVVLVGGPKNPKGAVVVVAGPEGTQAQPALLSGVGSFLHPRYVIDILCMQERGFGNLGLPGPEGLT